MLTSKSHTFRNIIPVAVSLDPSNTKSLATPTTPRLSLLPSLLCEAAKLWHQILKPPLQKLHLQQSNYYSLRHQKFLASRDAQPHLQHLLCPAFRPCPRCLKYLSYQISPFLDHLSVIHLHYLHPIFHSLRGGSRSCVGPKLPFLGGIEAWRPCMAFLETISQFPSLYSKSQNSLRVEQSSHSAYHSTQLILSIPQLMATLELEETTLCPGKFTLAGLGVLNNFKLQTFTVYIVRQDRNDFFGLHARSDSRL